MAEDVGDLLDRRAVLHQPSGQGVPQRVHAVTAFLTHRNVRRPGVLDQDLMQMVLLGERSDRGVVPQEHLRAVADRPTMTDVVDHRPADLFDQRQLHPVPGLGLRHAQPVARPVEVGELQPSDVDAAQPEPGDQHNDRVVPLPARIAPVDRVQDPGHVAGIPHRRDPDPLAGPHRRDRFQDSGVDQAVGGREPEEGTHRAQFLLDGLDLVSREGGDERLERRGVATSQPAMGAGERDELPGYRRIHPHRRYGAVSGAQQRLEPHDRVGTLPVQLGHGPGVAAQHRPVQRVIAQHLSDPEQIDIIRFERARPLLVEEATRLIDPRHRHVQGELLDATGSEEPLHPAPAAPIPDQRRVLVAQTPQLRVQTRHQRRHSRHHSRPPIMRAGTMPTLIRSSARYAQRSTPSSALTRPDRPTLRITQPCS